MPRIGDVTVRERTGKSWEEWFALLDEAGAAERPHAEIARSLADEHGLSGWWAQSITVEYEQSRGRREKHERPGGYEVGATQAIAALRSALARVCRFSRCSDAPTSDSKSVVLRPKANVIPGSGECIPASNAGVGATCTRQETPGSCSRRSWRHFPELSSPGDARW